MVFNVNKHKLSIISLPQKVCVMHAMKMMSFAAYYFYSAAFTLWGKITTKTNEYEEDNVMTSV